MDFTETIESVRNDRFKDNTEITRNMQNLSNRN